MDERRVRCELATDDNILNEKLSIFHYVEVRLIFYIIYNILYRIY